MYNFINVWGRRYRRARWLLRLGMVGLGWLMSRRRNSSTPTTTIQGRATPR